MTESPANDKIMAECPRFGSCNVPICPLDQFRKQRVKLPEDDTCSISKKVRLTIGLKHKLSNFGLKQSELSGILKIYPSVEAYALQKYGIRLDLIEKPPLKQNQNDKKVLDVRGAS
jgi:hypothetical protein